jgi:hypothetical protein
LLVLIIFVALILSVYGANGTHHPPQVTSASSPITFQQSLCMGIARDGLAYQVRKSRIYLLIPIVFS